jgi:hypothetical protein
MSGMPSLVSYYNNAYTLKTYFNWTLEEINNLLPYEYSAFIALLNKDIEERNRKAKERTAKHRSRS